MKYRDAVAKLAGRKSRKVGNNTYLETLEADAIGLRLHSTHVVTWKPDGSVILNSGGWQTVTTKDRINSYSPFPVHQEAGVWYVKLSDRQVGNYVTFADGVSIEADGTVHGQGPDAKDTMRLRKAIRQYARGFTEALLNGEIEKPSAGDCFYCHMVTEEGASLGDATKDRDHLMSHLEESYFVPSLLYNVLKESPVTDTVRAIIWSYVQGGEAWQGEHSFVSSTLPRLIKRYFYHRLCMVN